MAGLSLATRLGSGLVIHQTDRSRGARNRHLPLLVATRVVLELAAIMVVYKMVAKDGQKSIIQLPHKTFAEIGLKEREDLQASLAPHIEAISPDTLIISEEFRLSTWKDSNLRIDLLGIGKDAEIVVIELKRTEDAGYADLQAIRYASLVANLTFEKVVEIFRDYLKRRSENEEQEVTEPEHTILEFLGWDEPNEDDFVQKTRIVLASADFSQELTTSVMWLNESGLDIRCVRMRPYLDNEVTLLDIQTIIPLPEASDYQVAQKEKRLSEQSSRNSKKNRSKYDMKILSEQFDNLGVRGIVRTLVKCTRHDENVSATAMSALIPHQCFENEKLYGDTIKDNMREILRIDPDRYLLEDDEIHYEHGNTYVFWNNWTTVDTVKIAREFQDSFPSLGIEIEPRLKP